MKMDGVVAASGNIHTGSASGKFSGYGYSGGDYDFTGKSSLLYPPETKYCTCDVK